MKRVYVAMIQMLITVDDSTLHPEATCCDGISEGLREWNNSGFILDWAYVNVDGVLQTPILAQVADDYAEGDYPFAMPVHETGKRVEP